MNSKAFDVKGTMWLDTLTALYHDKAHISPLREG
jgi:hypothetical protein